MVRKTRNILKGYLSSEKTQKKCDICLKVKRDYWFRRTLFSRDGEMIICGDCAHREAKREYMEIRAELKDERERLANK